MHRRWWSWATHKSERLNTFAIFYAPICFHLARSHSLRCYIDNFACASLGLRWSRTEHFMEIVNSPIKFVSLWIANAPATILKNWKTHCDTNFVPIRERLPRRCTSKSKNDIVMATHTTPIKRRWMHSHLSHNNLWAVVMAIGAAFFYFAAQRKRFEESHKSIGRLISFFISMDLLNDSLSSAREPCMSEWSER